VQSAVRIPYLPNLSLAAVFETATVEEPQPAVVLLHGFTGWKEEAHIESLATALAQAGISSIRFDAPGSGESDGTFASNYRLSNYIESVGAVLQWLSAQKEVDTERIGTWGHSMGGFAAIASAVRHADRVKAVCGCQASRGGKVQLRADQQNDWQQTGWASFPNLHFRDLRLPYEFFLDRQKFDVFSELPRLSAPLQLIAGTRDTLVSPEHVREMFDAANEPKEFHEFNVDHFYKKSARQCAEINAVTVEFFRSRLFHSVSPT
jgi:pimeloyl-ACP methyl ester carboxylesterase